MAVLEVNASMGLIVAAPTAGSSGIVPGVVLSLKEEHDFLTVRLLMLCLMPEQSDIWPCAMPL